MRTESRVATSLGRQGGERLAGFVTYLSLLLISAAWLAPLAWMLTTALKSESQVRRLPISWWPATPTLENFRFVLQDSMLLRWTWNSFLVATITTIVVLAINSLAAYAFARIRFAGRDTLFYIVLITLMVPEQVIVVPLYLLMADLELVNTYSALIFPRLALALGIFLLRQFYLGLPVELEEAAEIDGCGRMTIFVRIVLPLSGPALSALAIFTFLGSWNSFLWPLVSVTEERMFTLPVGLANFQGTYNIEYAKVMAAALVASVPILAVFLAFQKQFIKGIALTGVKG
jgi:multiple sugar transport system permease protein